MSRDSYGRGYSANGFFSLNCAVGLLGSLVYTWIEIELTVNVLNPM